MTPIINALILSVFTYPTTPKSNQAPYQMITPDTSKPVLYLYVDHLPQFKGGRDSLNKFIRENFRWPNEDIYFEGTIITSFIIEKDGQVNDVKAIPGNCEPCGREAIKLMSKMPSWIPGKVKNRSVRTLIYFPVVFRLD